MSNLNEMTISRKIILSMSAIILVVIVLFAVAHVALSSTVSTFSSLIDNEAAMIQHGNAAKIAFLQCRKAEKDVLYNDDGSLVKSMENSINSMREESQRMVVLASNTDDSALIDQVKAFTQKIDDYQTQANVVFKATLGQERMMAALPMRKIANEAEKQLDSVIEKANNRIQDVKGTTLQHATRQKEIVLAVGGSVVGMGVLFSFLLILSIVRPLGNMARAMTEIAHEKLDTNIPNLGEENELGTLAEALETFKKNGHDRIRLTQEQQRQTQSQIEHSRRLEREVNAFEKTVASVVNSVAAAANQMQGTSKKLTGVAEQVSEKTSSASTGANQASANVQTVASSAEELTSSISEISSRVINASKQADEAKGQIEKTNQTMKDLASTAQNINSIVELVQEIASQTNLLALNATIEAARAGEAGKGFAVVASEVKNLANQTAKATEDIANQVGEVQAASNRAQGDIEAIAKTIADVNAIMSSIAASAEQQRAATQEISRSVSEAASGAQTVSTDISGISQASSESRRMAEETFNSANDLSKQAEILKCEVSGFIERVQSN